MNPDKEGDYTNLLYFCLFRKYCGYCPKHKVLNAVCSIGDSVLQGVIESNETHLIESMKGSRHITHRKPRKRGGVARERGISISQVSILVAWIGTEISTVVKMVFAEQLHSKLKVCWGITSSHPVSCAPILRLITRSLQS